MTKRDLPKASSFKKLSYDDFIASRIDNPTADDHRDAAKRLRADKMPGSRFHSKKAKELDSKK